MQVLCFPIVLAAIFSVFTCPVMAGADTPQTEATAPATVTATVPRWPHARAAAVTFTFDDGHLPHATELSPLFAERGIPVTFYIVTNWVGGENKATWDHWREAAALGHEIGNHSASHPQLPGLSDERLNREIVATAATISDEIGIAPPSYAYPFCKHDERVRELVFAHHASARAYFPLLEGTFNRDSATKRVAAAVNAGDWVVWLSHGLDAATLSAHLDEDLAPHQDHIWFATFAAASDWQRARDAASFTATTTTTTTSGTTTALQLSLPAAAETTLVPLHVHITGAPKTATIDGDLLDQPVWHDNAWLVSVPARNGISISVHH